MKGEGNYKRQYLKKWGFSYMVVSLIPLFVLMVFAFSSMALLSSQVRKANGMTCAAVETSLSSAVRQMETIAQSILLAPDSSLLDTPDMEEVSVIDLHNYTNSLRHLQNGQGYVESFVLYRPQGGYLFSPNNYWRNLDDFYATNDMELGLSKAELAGIFSEMRRTPLVVGIGGNRILVLRPVSYYSITPYGQYHLGVVLKLDESFSTHGLSVIITDPEGKSFLQDFSGRFTLETLPKRYLSMQEGSDMRAGNDLVYSLPSSFRGLRFYVVLSWLEQFRSLASLLLAAIILTVLATAASFAYVLHKIRDRWARYEEAATASGVDIREAAGEGNEYTPFIRSVKNAERNQILSRLLARDSSVTKEDLENSGVTLVGRWFTVFLAETDDDHWSMTSDFEEVFSQMNSILIPLKTSYQVAFLINQEEANAKALEERVGEAKAFSAYAFSEDVDTLSEMHHAYLQAVNRIEYRKSENAGGELSAEAYVVYRKALSELQSSFSDSQFNISVLADRLGISIGYLSKTFKKYNEGNISDYLLSLRLEKAREMLSEGKAVGEVYEASGFGSLRTFMRVFKDNEGVTPGQYKATRRKEDV